MRHFGAGDRVERKTITGKETWYEGGELLRKKAWIVVGVAFESLVVGMWRWLGMLEKGGLLYMVLIPTIKGFPRVCVSFFFFFFYFLLMLIWSEGVADGEFAWGMGPLQEK